jgi:hypothetical protein
VYVTARRPRRNSLAECAIHLHIRQMSLPSPPRPRMAFRVAIVGHRPNRLPATANDEVGRCVHEALDAVATAVDRQHEVDAALYRDEPPLLTLHSALAEGADRIGAQAALASSRWQLHAVLPYSAEEYRRDFEGAGAGKDAPREFLRLLEHAEHVTVLDGRPGTWEAYVPLARTLVESADLVIAVWDGRAASGPGGTGNVVRMARNEDVPVIRITPTAPAEMWLESLPDVDHGRAKGLSELSARLRDLLQPPADPDPALRWFNERGGPRATPWLFDAVMRGLARWQRTRRDPWSRASNELARDPGEVERRKWQAAWPELPPTMVQPLLERFAAQFGWADALGRWYAAAFRSSFSAVFLLAVASVATSGLLHLQPASERGWLWVVVPVLEPILLGVMLFVVWRARTQRYHDRWLDYRSLAERTRHLATLWPLARSSTVVRVPPDPVAFDPRLSWVGWLLRANARESGLVFGGLDEAYPVAARQMVLRREASEQRAFHRERRVRLERLSAPLELFAQRLVAVALLLALFRLFELSEGILQVVQGSSVDKRRETALVQQTWVILAAAASGLPALAAGIHGFLGIADFEGTAFRSAAIEGRLAELEGRLHRLDPVDLSGVADLTVEMTRTMEGELGAWHSATASRRLQAN